MADGNIVAAKKMLGSAIERLCHPKWEEFNRILCTQPCLYDQLQQDLAGTQGDNRTPAKSLPPIWIDAAQLIATIDATTRTWTARTGYLTTTERLITLTNRPWRPQDTDHVTDIAHTVEGWCDTISHLLNPEAVKHLDAPCPSCSREWIHRRDSGGDIVRKRALKWTPNVGFECQACTAHWPPDQTWFFSRLLGFELPEGVVE